MWKLLKRSLGAEPEKKPVAASKHSYHRKLEMALGPPLEPEEKAGNLSQLERSLNDQMKCQAGKNQVYIRSILTGSGVSTPRVALKCPLRRDIGQAAEVYLTDIKRLCCGDPTQCEAFRKFKDRHVPT